MSQDDRPKSAGEAPDFRRLPAKRVLDETITSVDADPVPDPDGGRNNAHYDALRDD